MTTLGGRLRKLRKDKKMTLKKLAEKFDMALSTISGYELNDKTPSKEVLEKYADFFGVSVDWMMGRSEEEFVQDLGELDLKKMMEKHKEITWDGVPMSDEDRERFIILAQMLLDMKKRSSN